MIRSTRAWPRIVAHADMDAFYAAIEQLDDPTLRGKPLLVGPPSARGVVLTASYEARPYGVGSAMPMAQARRRCPSAIIVPPRFDRYQEVSQTIMEVFSNFSPEVEALSLDEAFLEMSGSEGTLWRSRKHRTSTEGCDSRRHRWAYSIGRSIGNQIRRQSRERLPQAGWADCCSTGRS